MTSATPAFATACKRCRPIQPTPTKPRRGSLTCSSATRPAVERLCSISIIGDDCFEKVGPTLAERLQGGGQPIEVKGMRVKRTGIQTPLLDRLHGGAHARDVLARITLVRV